MQKLIYSGTFDPPTVGHFDIIQRAVKLCGTLIIALPAISQKSNVKSVDVRVELLEKLVEDFASVQVKVFDGLIAEFAKQEDVNFIIRGLRGPDDLIHENTMAVINKQLTGIETLFIGSTPKYSHISSSIVRELLSYTSDITEFVPTQIQSMVCNYYSAKS